MYDKNNPAILSESYLKIYNVLLDRQPCFNITSFGQQHFGDIISIKNSKADCISLKAFTTSNKSYLIKQLSKAPQSTSIQVLDGFNNTSFSRFFDKNILPIKGSLIPFKPFTDLDVLQFLEIFNKNFKDSDSLKNFSNEKFLIPLSKGDLELINKNENK